MYVWTNSQSSEGQVSDICEYNNMAEAGREGEEGDRAPPSLTTRPESLAQQLLLVNILGWCDKKTKDLCFGEPRYFLKGHFSGPGDHD
ncbi:hypothetical protein E2C01_079809 [Portunus trituberculatus]|uniref:Uncharacterized protein n=1 Tax=Portunus trituberculatus TaxID=210409 RepID=A0A5B7IHV0_PORTR|nr:hypothetical protein [Portunus trituberculatus]